MSEQHPYRATIDPIPAGESRPCWSVMIPTYNCAAYLRETLTSVLAQAPGSDQMQIEVVDDCSTIDDPAAVVDELGHGRVAFYRQAANVGYIRNFETCLQRARGRLVHLLHGDDLVRDGFYRKLDRAFADYPEVGAAFCRQILMDAAGHWQILTWLERSESGILNDWLRRITVQQRIQTPSIVVRRDVYERLGSFDRRFRCSGEDWEMWIRIAAQYPVWYEVEPLAIYRMHPDSLSGHAAHSGADIRDLGKVLTIIRSYLPAFLPGPVVDELITAAARDVAFQAIQTAERLLLAGDLVGANAQLRAALACSQDPHVLRRAVWLFARARAHLLRRAVGRTRMIPGRPSVPTHSPVPEREVG